MNNLAGSKQIQSCLHKICFDLDELANVLVNNEGQLTKRKKRDLNLPKLPFAAYTYFLKSVQNEIADCTFIERSRLCSQKWKAISAKERKVFDDLAAEDKKRFEQEMKEFKSGDFVKKKSRVNYVTAPSREDTEAEDEENSLEYKHGKGYSNEEEDSDNESGEEDNDDEKILFNKSHNTGKHRNKRRSKGSNITESFSSDEDSS